MLGPQLIYNILGGVSKDFVVDQFVRGVKEPRGNVGSVIWELYMYCSFFLSYCQLRSWRRLPTLTDWLVSVMPWKERKKGFINTTCIINRPCGYFSLLSVILF